MIVLKNECLNECSANRPIKNPLQQPALPTLLPSISHAETGGISSLRACGRGPEIPHSVSRAYCLLWPRAVLTAHRGETDQGGGRTKARDLKCQEGMPAPREENTRKPGEGPCPDVSISSLLCCCLRSCWARVSANKAGALGGFLKLEENRISLKCARTHSQTHRGREFRVTWIPTPLGNLFSSYSHAIETHRSTNQQT